DGVGETAPGAEIGHLETGRFVFAGRRAEPVQFAVELLACLFQNDVAVAVAVAHLADDRQQWNLEENDVQPRAAQANTQLAVFDAGVDIAQVEAEQAEETQKIRLEEGNALQKA